MVINKPILNYSIYISYNVPLYLLGDEIDPIFII